MDKFFPYLKSFKSLPPPRDWIPWAVALIAAVALFLLVRNTTTCWQLTALPGIPPAACAGATTTLLRTPSVPNAQGTSLPPTQPVGVPQAPAPQWDGGSRINIVFFGLRGGDPVTSADCPLCTDTIIVFTLDPITKTAGMINVPHECGSTSPASASAASTLPGPTASVPNCPAAAPPWR